MRPHSPNIMTLSFAPTDDFPALPTRDLQCVYAATITIAPVDEW